MINEPLVLLADNSIPDTLLMRTVFKRAGFTRPLELARGGAEAISRLRLAPLPSVLLLDLNMPRVNGFDVLSWIGGQPFLRGLKVFVLSASSRSEDIELAYDLGAHAYLVKPGNLDGLLALAQCLAAWVQVTHETPESSVLDLPSGRREAVAAFGSLSALRV